MITSFTYAMAPGMVAESGELEQIGIAPQTLQKPETIAPIDGLLKSNKLLVEKVLPKLGVELEQIQPQSRDNFSGRGWRD